jgi:uncharacterized protein with HEPN domain
MRQTAEQARQQLLEDLASWAERLAGHVRGMTREAFLADALVQDAACRCVGVLGEAARRLMAVDPGIETRHPALGLREIVGARNRLAHEYQAVDYAVIWKAATDSAPAMAAAARRVMAGLAGQDGD